LLSGRTSSELAKALGISFPDQSSPVVLLTRDGKQYVIDTNTKTVKEIQTEPHLVPASMQGQSEKSAASLFQQNCSPCHGNDGKGNKAIGTPNFTDPAFIHSVSAEEMRSAIEKGKNGRMPAWSGKLTEEQISDLVAYIRSLPADANSTSKSGQTTQIAQADQKNGTVYRPGDDLLVSLPTGKPTDRHGVYINFTHRFAYDTTFRGPARGAELFGLDNVAIASFGFRYGITDRLSVSAFRSSSLINRPIQLMAAYDILQEQNHEPFNAMVRVSIEGQDNFRKNFTENIEGIFSRSITSRAQIYLVPTFSFNDRELLAPSGFFSNGIADVPGVNAFSLGAGLAVDVRPSVSLLAELIPTFLNERELDIHRPVYSFGIQKKIWRHAFTLAFTTSPGSTVSQRAATRASFLGEPGADTLSGLTVGFNLMRQIH
jgi:mono/diheme cytochrome c family protein